MLRQVIAFTSLSNKLHIKNPDPFFFILLGSTHILKTVISRNDVFAFFCICSLLFSDKKLCSFYIYISGNFCFVGSFDDIVSFDIFPEINVPIVSEAECDFVEFSECLKSDKNMKAGVFISSA